MSRAAGRPRTAAGIGTEHRHRDVVVNGVRLHLVEAGRGVPVVLLHGFPEFWYAWRRQIGPLAEAGARVLAPDLRGCAGSEKPHGVDAYRVDRLTGDVVELLEAEAPAGAVLVGHDWGGVLAWRAAMARPDLLRRLVVLNAPHPTLYARGIRRPRQMLRSWYVFAFRVPRLPELVLRAFDFAVLERAWRRDPVREGAFTADDVAAYKAALGRPGALTAMLNWYRAAVGRRPRRRPRRRGGARPPRGSTRKASGSGGEASGSGGEAPGPEARIPDSREPRIVDVPTLVVWGERDRYLGPELLDGLETLVSDLRVERIAEASHWVHADAPERVNQLLIEVVEAES